MDEEPAQVEAIVAGVFEQQQASNQNAADDKERGYVQSIRHYPLEA